MIILRFARSHIRVLPVVIPLFVLWCPLPAQQTKSVPGVYRVYSGLAKGFEVWIVDGKIVREAVDPEFLYGGNHERYPWIPTNEIWIDNAISCEEFHYTLEHELCERELMALHGWSYDAAHDSALMVEQQLRLGDLRLKQEHEHTLYEVSTTDSYGTKEISRLGDSLRLHNIYRLYVGKRDTIDIWIVDGSNIRRDIYPDFGLSGNDLAYHFIPAGEIWLDAQVSCEEMEFSIRRESAERTLMAAGLLYDDAYEKALMFVRSLRNEFSKKAAKMPPIRLSGRKQ
jgi:hypothetical protein